MLKEPVELDVGNGGGRVGPEIVVAPVPPVIIGAVPDDAMEPVPIGTDDGGTPVPLPVLPTAADEFAVGKGKGAVNDRVV